jgi:hypothetical protein
MLMPMRDSKDIRTNHRPLTGEGAPHVVVSASLEGTTHCDAVKTYAYADVVVQQTQENAATNLVSMLARALSGRLAVARFATLNR